MECVCISHINDGRAYADRTVLRESGKRVPKNIDDTYFGLDESGNVGGRISQTLDLSAAMAGSKVPG
jgi:hypothetical protein